MEENIEKKKILITKRHIELLVRILKSKHFVDTFFYVPTCVKVVLCRRRAGVGQLAVVGV